MDIRIRKNILPKTVSDFAATLFLLGAIPVTFWFEVWIVLPTIHMPGSFFYIFHTVAALYLMANIVANFMAVTMCDTSIKHEILSPPPGLTSNGTQSWHLCAVCETIAPPRSWHCEVCKTCILKRDHHCIFTSCCIGHKNHRYFIVMIALLFVATSYASIYNSIFIWIIKADDFRNWETGLKIMFPLFIFMIETSSNNLYLVVYLISVVGSFFTGVLLVYHLNLVLKGAVVHERNSVRYDYGKMANLRLVLGTNWKWTWLSPYIKSPLPHNGIDWEPQETEKTR
jgi:palmitoyltransferase